MRAELVGEPGGDDPAEDLVVGVVEIVEGGGDQGGEYGCSCDETDDFSGVLRV